MDWTLRLAREQDIPAIEKLIPLSVRALQSSYYSAAQMEAALGPVYGVDRELISDGTYFAADLQGELIGCGGWSKRRAMYGGDQGRARQESEQLNPKLDPARMRAFYVHPDWARRGIGRQILQACEAAARAAGFTKIELSATLAGEPLYAAFGYAAMERYEIPMTGGLSLPVVKMTKNF